MTDKENYIARQVLDRLLKSKPAGSRSIWSNGSTNEEIFWDEAAIKEFAKQYQSSKGEKK